jgi:acyl-CoA dehydrogenase
MTEEDHGLLFDTAERVFSEHCGPATLANAEAGQFPEGLRRQLAGIGLFDILLPESSGGIQAQLTVFAGVLRIAGRFAAPLPLAEEMVARWLLGEAKCSTGSGQFLLAIDDWRANSGQLTSTTRQPCDSKTDSVVVIRSEPNVAFLSVVAFNAFSSRARKNIAGEHLIDLVIDREIVIRSGQSIDPSLKKRADKYPSLARAALIVGAAERALEMSLVYAGERVQFGRPIAKFQAVQQLLACLAGAVAASSAITMAAAREMDRGGGEALLDAARIRLSDAVDSIAAISHQVHGAIAFTREYQLQYFTRRLLAWRDEGSPTAQVRQRFAARFAACNADDLWPTLIASTVGAG